MSTEAWTVVDPTACPTCGKDSCEDHLPPPPTRPPNDAGPDAYTDAAIAERFVTAHAPDLRFHHRLKQWLRFGPHHFRVDEDGGVKRLLIEFARGEQARALDIRDIKLRKRTLDAAMQFEQAPRIERALSLAQALKPVADAGTGWDADPMLLGVPNGVVDLQTGRLRAGRPGDRITLSTAVPFETEAEAPRWKRFIHEVFGGDEELMQFVHRAIGYTLTGSVAEQCAFIEHGTGSNGKTTLNETLSAVLGDYASNAPFSTFELKDRESISADVARLEGKRFVRASETNDGKRLNEARIKMLCGGDVVTARYLHRNHVEFKPTLKLWLSVNHLPVVRDDSFGFWRRIRLIPFLRTFPVDDTVRRTLDAERPGILAWAVRGCLAWQEHRLTAPAAVQAATDEYQQESDPLADFIDECCQVAPDAVTKAAAVQSLYNKWAERQGILKTERLSNKALSQRLAHRFRRRHLKAGWVYEGFELVTGQLW